MSKMSWLLGAVAGGFLFHWAMTGDRASFGIALVVAGIGMVRVLREGKNAD